MIRNKVIPITVFQPGQNGKMYPMTGNAPFAELLKRISKRRLDT
jgi:hypothetical protein